MLPLGMDGAMSEERKRQTTKGGGGTEEGWVGSVCNAV